MHRMPLWLAILCEISLIACHDNFKKPDIWYVIGINGVFILYSIFQIIYDLGLIPIDLDWLPDTEDLHSFIFIIALIGVAIWLFLCFIGVCEFRLS